MQENNQDLRAKSKKGQQDWKGFEWQGYSRSLKCRAGVCTTKVSATPSKLQLGDCLMGVRKTISITLTNHSEMLTEVRILCNSKSIRFRELNIELPPLHSQPLEIEFTPSSAKRDYKKQITIKNIYNPTNTEMVEVEATLLSTESSALYSFFYR